LQILHQSHRTNDKPQLRRPKLLARLVHLTLAQDSLSALRWLLRSNKLSRLKSTPAATSIPQEVILNSSTPHFRRAILRSSNTAASRHSLRQTPDSPSSSFLGCLRCRRRGRCPFKACSRCSRCTTCSRCSSCSRCRWLGCSSCSQCKRPSGSPLQMLPLKRSRSVSLGNDVRTASIVTMYSKLPPPFVC
jgi:hypothetical protein